MKMEFSSQRIEIFLFLTTNMAALTLRYVAIVKWCEKQRRVRRYSSETLEEKLNFILLIMLDILMLIMLDCLDIEKNIYYYCIKQNRQLSSQNDILY